MSDKSPLSEGGAVRTFVVLHSSAVVLGLAAQGC